jgi:hypothetical protein
VKELVEDGSFDKQVMEQVQVRRQADAAAQARSFLERVKNTETDENR